MLDIRRVRVSNCGQEGFDLVGAGELVDAVVIDIAGRGAFLSERVFVRDSVFYRTGGEGISIGVCGNNVLSDNGAASGTGPIDCTVQIGPNTCDSVLCPTTRGSQSRQR